MVTIFNRTQLIVSQDIQAVNHWIGLLKKQGIEYKLVSQSIGHNTRRDGMIGGIGESPQYNTIYTLYVPRTMLQQAKYICRIQ